MLFRLVRPVKRQGSRHHQFVRRIPSDVRSKAVGLKLAIPVGEQTQTIVISPRAQSVRLSLRTDDPVEVKARLVRVDAYLENVWRALREDAPVSLTHRQATALAGELYRAWADGESRERTIATNLTNAQGIERRGDTLKVSRQLKDTLASGEGLNKILMQAATIPYVENGKLIGFRLLEIDRALSLTSPAFRTGTSSPISMIRPSMMPVSQSGLSAA